MVCILTFLNCITFYKKIMVFHFHFVTMYFVPSSKFTVFSHQFSSIAGACPVTGPILASVFGWVPVLLWLIIGGLFFGAVQDFGALYASVKNEGKSMGMIIEKYIGKTGRKLFMLFCWLFTLLVIAAFTDMVAGTFVGTGVEGMTEATSYANSAAAFTTSFIFPTCFWITPKITATTINNIEIDAAAEFA